MYGNIYFDGGPHSGKIGSQAWLALHIFCITEQKSFVNIVSEKMTGRDGLLIKIKNANTSGVTFMLLIFC
jgi:hypothetical protein